MQQRDAIAVRAPIGRRYSATGDRLGMDCPQASPAVLAPKPTPLTASTALKAFRGAPHGWVLSPSATEPPGRVSAHPGHGPWRFLPPGGEFALPASLSFDATGQPYGRVVGRIDCRKQGWLPTPPPRNLPSPRCTSSATERRVPHRVRPVGDRRRSSVVRPSLSHVLGRSTGRFSAALRPRQGEVWTLAAARSRPSANASKQAGATTEETNAPECAEIHDLCERHPRHKDSVGGKPSGGSRLRRRQGRRASRSAVGDWCSGPRAALAPATRGLAAPSTSRRRCARSGASGAHKEDPVQ